MAASWFEYFIIHYRWVFVMILLPISFSYDLFFFIRNKIMFVIRALDTTGHDEKVRVISDEIKDWVKTGRKGRMCTARPGWQAMSLRSGKYKKTYKNININLHKIIEINEQKRTCRVEPMVTMGQLTHLLLPQGWVIPVLPELDDLTVGGLVAGCGIETSSHKYGLFQEICVGFEIVLSDGSIVKCSAEERPDLFYMIPWSYGTLGFVVSVEIMIIPCTPYVDMTYIPYHTETDALKSFRDESLSKEFDFVEC